MSKNKSLRVVVEKLSFGGMGIARHDGRVIFIPLSAPQDVLQVEITESKKDYDFAEITQILEPSAQRTQAPCPIYGQCGGCDLQHLNYEHQIASKQMILKEFFEKTGAVIEDFVQAPAQFAYRNRIQVHKLNNTVGFRKRKSHDIVKLTECLIAEPSINKQIADVLKKPDGRYEISQSEIANQNEDQTGFSQVNTQVNALLIRESLKAIQAAQPEEVLELFSGNGNFSMPILEQLSKVLLTTVELDQNLVEQAKIQLARKKLSAKVFCSDVDFFLRRFQFEKQKSLLFLDPPRAGLSESARHLIGVLKPKDIVYISCDPATLRRDIQSFSRIGYRLTHIQGFDMFPQTHHIETLARLQIDLKA